MRCCRASLLVCLTLLLHSGEAKVLTESQSGPLYRVLGAPLSISCNVSGLKGDNSRNEFKFLVTKPKNPSFEINIISTSDEGFAYAVYSQRVARKEITLKHVSPNSVLFEIQSLQKGDEGDFECVVINPDHRGYDGTYSAKTIVKVIDDSLSVSSLDSTSLSHNEGDALTLTCQASSNTIQHTHLSLTWLLQKDGEQDARPIISLDRDFTLIPGPSFEGRYHEGLIRLDKMGEATYKLHMAKLEESDQGTIYCRAQEWIQDPDRSWYTITQKDAESTALLVKASEVVRDTSSLVVRISIQQTALQEGQELSLSCNVDNLEKRFLSVTWLRGSVELARVEPTGILSVGPEYSGREKRGELRAARIGDTEYRLRLKPVRTEDQGEYVCRARPQERGQDGAFTAGEAQTSNPQLVSISASESGLSVEMQHNVSVDEGDRLKLTCKVDGVEGQLSVTWERQSTSTFENIISLSQEGVTEIEGGSAGRGVRAARPATDTFTLELDEVTPSDSGIYQCSVSEWKTNSKIRQSKTSTVTVRPTESSVKLISRKTSVTVGENVELMCRVQGPRVPTTLIWSLQQDDSTIQNILTLNWNGDISWSGDQQIYQLGVENKPKAVTHYLLINGASPREAGKYQCQASAFIHNVHKKPRPSNQLAVMVQYPESKLSLTSPPTLTKNINSDIEINCSVTSEPFASSQYAVTWRHQQQGENKTILSSDRDALVTFGTQVEASDRQRISMRRSKGPSFELTIRKAQISDDGSYICEVTEWLQEPRGAWYQLPPKSQITELNLIEPANDLRLEVVGQQRLIAGEGDEVELKCNILSGAVSPSVFYKVAWFYTGQSSPKTNVSLVELNHMGLLRYPESEPLRDLQGRLRLARPTQSSFHLRIQPAHEGDSGTFQCQVEQYQLDREGHWQQKASESAGPISLTVNLAEKNLSIVKDERELNVSRSEDFAIPCHVANQPSGRSEFQVTWFWQKETGIQKWPIFVAYRNATLQDMLVRGHQLRFGHPAPNQFSLTVSKPAPENSGLYFCEVEEWLPSLSRGWRKVAVETSGHLTVNVLTEGEVTFEQQCKSGTWIGILVVVVICSLLVISLLVLKICRTNASGGKKSGESLWAEEHPLNTKLDAAN